MLSRLLKLIISLIFYIFYQCFAAILSLLKKPLPGSIVVLTYHSVKSDQRSKFNKHMNELLKFGHPVFADIITPPGNGRRYFAVTFDDGFQSILKNALPVLRKCKIPATIFVTVGFLGRKPDWISNPKHENANEIILTEEQLKQISDDLISIGSHSITHPHLAEIDRNKAIRELNDSKKTLEGIMNTEITLFSFPYGSYNKEIIEFSRKAGYERVFLNIPTFTSSKIGDYLIGRINISLDDWMIEYRLKLLNAYQWLPVAIFIKQKFMDATKTILSRK